MGGYVSRDRDLRLVHPEPRTDGPIVPNEVLGTVIFVLAEMMMFGGFISAYSIASSTAVVWPPPGQPRLPVETTALNTVALLISGGLAWWAGRRFDTAGPDKAKLPMFGALALGAFFVLFQGYEWAMLLSQGLTLTSSNLGAFFYLIVGAHALHAVGGLAVLVVLTLRLVRGQLRSDPFWAGRLFWYFVVLLWPVLYWKVYL